MCLDSQGRPLDKGSDPVKVAIIDMAPEVYYAFIEKVNRSGELDPCTCEPYGSGRLYDPDCAIHGTPRL